MSYNRIVWDHIGDPKIKNAIKNADMLYRDLYGIFKLPVDNSSGEGGGNFAILLVLLCIIDGISSQVYPTNQEIEKQGERFKKFICDKLFWKRKEQGWIDISLAADQLYNEYRNPLVHALAADESSSVRSHNHGEPVFGKWGKIPSGYHDIDKIDNMLEWRKEWPVVYSDTNQSCDSINVSGAALYWALKNTIIELIK